MTFTHVQRKADRLQQPSSEPAPVALTDVQLKELGYDAASDKLAPRDRGYAQQAGELAPVQAKIQAKGQADGDVHRLASEGVQGSGGSLPHMDAIQTAFGHHDVSAVQAYSGGAASQATRGMGAEAYATGDKVAFGSSPSLHTAAHEAAHVVQQRAGVSLKGGVGASGDRYEQHADRVADLVVQGKSAQGALDEMAAPAPALQQKAQRDIQRKQAVQKRPRKKTISGAASGRMGPAAAAISHTKSVFSMGAGNQYDALKDTKFNSNYRLKVMRNFSKYWEYDYSIATLANQNPAALTHAMAEIAKGGNCGEHATVAYDYLNATAKGQKITKAAVKGFDHAFVLIGDLATEGDADIVVSDPWPSAATAVLWEDHFAYAVSSDRADIDVKMSTTADGSNAKDVIKAGIRLNALGLKTIEMAKTEEDTDQALKDGTDRSEGKKPWIWRHADTHATGKQFDYVPES